MFHLMSIFLLILILLLWNKEDKKEINWIYLNWGLISNCAKHLRFSENPEVNLPSATSHQDQHKHEWHEGVGTLPPLLCKHSWANGWSLNCKQRMTVEMLPLLGTNGNNTNQLWNWTEEKMCRNWLKIPSSKTSLFENNEVPRKTFT